MDNPFLKPQVIVMSSSFPKLKWILGGITALILLLVVLTYLNISPVITIPCPVPQEFCRQGKPIIYQGKTFGLGFSLAADTPLTAVFPGATANGLERNEGLKIMVHPVRWLSGKDDFAGYTATYSFFGTPSSAKSFALGETIAAIATDSAQAFPKEEPFSGVNFIFSVTKGGKNGPPVEFKFK